ncbi:HlyD family efflux transporter periplasmic adaptor subunit [Seohaeicola saemankumensis]|uniref:efflux RND transporter periplasmic adaptor subunit n=1 Tax=Seohaeicola saemankumensis TaxID=481181 RepID=UPI001E537078|nr:HlyD family efflux transporter periplasmic adaptor subunit [Seohaeicola saemankumensis]MCD1626208.1 HlyD family efflux transporter periplasmic adaptor subunit [Seohaeicola saemankumensis]
MRFLRQSLTGLFLLSLTLALLIMAGQTLRDAVQDRLSREARMPEGRERVFSVNVVTAEAATVTPVLTAFGEVQSGRTLEIRAAVGGSLLELAPEFVEGGVVSEGQVLFRIDPADAEAALARAQADATDSAAEMRDAARALELAQDELLAAEEQAALRERAALRQRDIAARGVGSEAAVETAELAASAARQAVLTRHQAIAQAEARLAQSETSRRRSDIALAEAERRLDDTVARARFSGVLSGVSIVEGRLVSANEQLGQLIDPDRLEVAFRISTAQYARLLDGAGKLKDLPVRLRLDMFGIDLEREGRLSRDSAAVAEGQSGRLLYAAITDPAGLKPGDFVTVEVDEPPLDRMVRLPGSAMDSSNTVLVLGAADRLEELPVTLVRRQANDILVQGEGLEGREVVAERSPLLGAGIGVRPLRGPSGAIEDVPAPDLLELTSERRARLVAFVEGNDRMPAEMRTRLLAQLQAERVPAEVVQRLEQRIGG